MFQVGDKVVYGIHGVCQIIDLEAQRIDRKTINYFVLEPVNQPGTKFYVPSENPSALSKLRQVISKQELEDLLRSPDVKQDCWIGDENSRKQRYRELICSGDRRELLKMIHTLHYQRKLQLDSGRKFHLCDDNFLRDAEKLLNSEFSLVLGIEPGEVGKYIVSAME